MIIGLFFITIISIASCGEKKCQTFNSCTECVTHKTWGGKPCRWCPRYNECHAEGSTVNKCSKTENFININDCNRKLPEFDEDEAWKMLQLSAAAYSNSPENCFHAIENSDFQLYSTTIRQNCPRSTECFAYTAISHLRKAIVVAYRGSVDTEQVKAQFWENLIHFKRDIGDGSIYSYYYDAYEVFRPCILTRIQELLTMYGDYTVYFTGHSLGGAVASVTSTMLTMLGYIPRDKVKLITFGQPRVGTYLAAATHDRNVYYSFRVTHARDLVVHYPSCLHVPVVTSCVGIPILKAPYHHGKEVFYSRSMTVGKKQYKICNGKPFNEDTTCADGTPELTGYSIDDHINYFGVHVSKYGENGCGSRRSRHKRTDFEEYDQESRIPVLTFAELNRTVSGNVSIPEENVTLKCRIFKISPPMKTSAIEIIGSEITMWSVNTDSVRIMVIFLLFLLLFACCVYGLKKKKKKRQRNFYTLFNNDDS